MKTIKELRSIIDFSIREINYHLKYFIKLKIDMDVYLPTRMMNLQRSLVWTLEQKRELIWSIFYERHIGRLAIVTLKNGTIQIIDGKQRLSAIFQFYKNEFTIEIDGKEYFYKDLPKEYQLEIRNYSLAFYEYLENYDIPATDQQKINWFNIINFAGTPQDKEHMEKLKEPVNF